MLNIAKNSIKGSINTQHFASLKQVYQDRGKKRLPRVLIILLLLFVLFVFLPWTQNIRANGTVIALKPGQRPQTINSIIGGRIEKWFVQEGDLVKKGDTILYVSEIKDEYFDPNLLARTNEQLKSKEMSVNFYMEKVKAMDNQVSALAQGLILKQEQAANKLLQARLSVKSDSIDLQAFEVNYKIALEQYKRMQELHEKGLKSLTDLENRKLKLQETNAKMIAQENKLLSSRNQLINARIELSSIKADFRDKISKSESEKFSALSGMYDAEAVVTKLQNQYSNYLVRSGMYYITAPQDGFITKALRSGIGETIKEGTEILSIMPANIDVAVEVFVKPIDIPLLGKGSKVRVQFDGWPAIVFSGWPNVSYGTYGGKVVAIDNFISENGKYRVLVVPDTNDHAWPKEIRVGAGVSSMMLLKDVPIWYELWRKINGFPPEYYKQLSTKPSVNK
jgi:multidrug efflux pump subunit AcrA (membrane-fusion protein)